MFALVALAFTLSNCSKSGDPAPAATTKTNLQIVQASMVGTWKFSTMAVMENSSSKTASTTSCSKSELASAGFANTNWKAITPEDNYAYSSGNAVQFTNNCASVNVGTTVSAVQNTDGSVTLTFGNGDIYNVKTNDVTTTSVKAKYLTGNALSEYTVIVTFTKS